MEVFLANEQNLPADEARLTALARHTLMAESVDDNVELSILLVDSQHIKELNTRFAGVRSPTDVLAFPMIQEEEEGLLLGDVVICPEVASVNAQRFSHRLEDELDMLIVHGTLHLLGYDHQGSEDRARMDERQRTVLESFSHSPS